MDNTPKLWIDALRPPPIDGHKYDRGQVAVLGGTEMTGAACMSADAAARIGAGIVTIICPHIPLWKKRQITNPNLIYKSFKPYIIAREKTHLHNFVSAQKSKGRIVSVIGPGLGNDEYNVIRSIAHKTAKAAMPMILDADGINAFEGHTGDLKKLSALTPLILTPHDGEFKKLCPHLKSDLEKNRIKAAQLAAQELNITLVLKGKNTIIANQQKTVINKHASPYLATAGSGDILTGLIAGLRAQGITEHDAACAAVWIHGEASINFGAGLVATDILDELPKILKSLDSIGV